MNTLSSCVWPEREIIAIKGFRMKQDTRMCGKKPQPGSTGLTVNALKEKARIVFSAIKGKSIIHYIFICSRRAT